MCRKQRRTFLFSMQKVKLFSFIVQKMFLWNSRQYFALFHPDLCQFNPNSHLGSVKRCSEFNFSFNDRYSYFSYVFSIQNTYFLKVCVLDNTYLSLFVCSANYFSSFEHSCICLWLMQDFQTDMK